MFNWLTKMFGNRQRPREISPPVPHKDPLGAVIWMESSDPENPFGIRVLNCMSSAMGLLSVTSDASIAKRYNALRSDDGRRLIGHLPEDAIEAPCDLAYPMDGPANEGPIYLSSEMEGKWDIYLYANRLYLARSWTGQLIFLADVKFTPGITNAREIRLSRVFASRVQALDRTEHAVRMVDFLIKSHIYRWHVPAPIPVDFPSDPQALATYLFGTFGRHAIAGTYEDTLPFGPRGERRQPEKPD